MVRKKRLGLSTPNNTERQRKIMKKIVWIICLIVGGFLSFIGGSAVGARSEENNQPNVFEVVESDSAIEVTRCGWLSNPTPANFWLDDKDGQWIIGVQGGHQAKGADIPEFPDSQWVQTNGSYGYGCACLKGTFSTRTKKVQYIKSATVRTLSACRKDKMLKEPKEENGGN